MPEENDLSKQPKLEIDPEVKKIFDHLTDVLKYFKLQDLVGLKVTGGWLRSRLNDSFCSDYIEYSIKNYPPEEYSQNCNVNTFNGDLDIMLETKVPI